MAPDKVENGAQCCVVHCKQEGMLMQTLSWCYVESV